MVSHLLNHQPADGLPPELPLPGGFEASEFYEVFETLKSQHDKFSNLSKISFERTDAFLRHEKKRKQWTEG